MYHQASSMIANTLFWITWHLLSRMNGFSCVSASWKAFLPKSLRINLEVSAIFLYLPNFYSVWQNHCTTSPDEVWVYYNLFNNYSVPSYWLNSLNYIVLWYNSAILVVVVIFVLLIFRCWEILDQYYYGVPVCWYVTVVCLKSVVGWILIFILHLFTQMWTYFMWWWLRCHVHNWAMLVSEWIWMSHCRFILKFYFVR